MADKVEPRLAGGAAKGAEHGAVVHRLRRGDGGVGVAHGRTGNHAALQNQRGFDAKESRLPQHQIRQLTDFNRANFVGNAVGNGGVDGVLGDIAFSTQVIGPQRFIFRQQAALHLHFVRRLPGAADDFTYATHGLGVGGDHRDHAQVVQNILGGDGFTTNTRIGKGHVFGNIGIQVVADHEHVEMLVDGVHRVGPRGVGGGRQHVLLGAGSENVRGVAAACAFGVVGVNAALFKRRQGVFHEAGFVERIGVDGDLHIVLFRHAQAGINRGGGSAPVFMQLETHRARFQLCFEPFWQAGVAFAEQTDVHGQVVHRLKHLANVPLAGGAGGGVGARGGAGAAAQHGGNTAHQRFFHLLGADKVNVGVDAACGEDFAFTGDHFGTGANDDLDIGLGVGVACLADGGDAAVLQPYIGFDDAPPV